MASEILGMMMDSEDYSNEMVRAIPVPISLKKAYYEHSYRISDE